MILINFNHKKAEKLLSLGSALRDAGKISAAIDKLNQAVHLHPTSAKVHYLLGELYKQRSEWEACLNHSFRASELDPEDESTLWNLAIAATALKKWPTSRETWKRIGIQLVESDGPIAMDLGVAPVRLNPQNQSEVVWGRRLDPVRVKIDNVPYETSGFRYGDTVLHDAIAVGYRKYGNRCYPVFNVLGLFEASSYQTSRVVVEIASEEDMIVLEELFSETEHRFEDWTTSVRNVCKRCSEGKPHDHHHQPIAAPWSAQRHLGVAIHNNRDIGKLFDHWHHHSDGRLITIDQR